MEAATLRQLHPTAYDPAPRAAATATLDEDWDWVYDDPDLAPFRGGRQERKETPLTAWVA